MKKDEEYFDQYSDKYTSLVNNSVAFTGLGVDFFTKVKAGYIVDFCDVHNIASASSKALDVGCGVGSFHSLLINEFKELHGVDVSADSISKASDSHPLVEYKTYSGSRLPYESDTFDVVFTVCVLHHVPTDDWQQFVNEMCRVVKKGGLVLIFEHNPKNPLTMKAVNNCPFDIDAVLLKSNVAMDLMVGAGLGEVKRRYILSIPAANRFLRKVDSLFSSARLGAQYLVSGTKPTR